MNKICLNEVIPFMDADFDEDDFNIFSLRKWFFESTDMNEYARLHLGKYIYKDGNLIEIVRPNKYKIKLFYNDNKLTKISSFYCNRKIEFEYDSINGYIKRIYSNNFDITINYNWKLILKNSPFIIIHIAYKQKNEKTQHCFMYYDHERRLTEYKSIHGYIEFCYLPNGNLMRYKTNMLYSRNTPAIDNINDCYHTTDFVYDPNGHIIKIMSLVFENTDKSIYHNCYNHEKIDFRHITDFQYNNKHKLTQININDDYIDNFQYNDKTGLLQSVEGPLTDNTYSLDLNNHFLTIRSSGIKTYATYDKKMQLRSIYNLYGDNQLSADIKYQYDNNGNIIHTAGTNIDDIPFASVVIFDMVNQKNNEAVNRNIIETNLNRLIEVY